MKNIIYLPVMLIFLFTSCSSNDQDFLPTSPQSEVSLSKKENYPYRYLQSFVELKNLKYQVSESDNGAFLIIDAALIGVKHLFAVIEEGEIQSSHLVFLGNGNSGKYFIPGINGVSRFKLRVYAYMENSRLTDSKLPYRQSQFINNIPIKEWSVSNSSIEIISSDFPIGLSHVYAELNTKEGFVLLFLEKPESENFRIPKYGDLGIIDVSLFGYTELYIEGKK